MNIIIGVVVGMAAPLILLILVTALIICCLCIKRQGQKQMRAVDWTQDIFVTYEIPHIARESSLKKANNSSMSLQPVDPFEFPRNKLVFLNTLLGKYLYSVHCSPLRITSCTQLSAMGKLNRLGLPVFITSLWWA